MEGKWFTEYYEDAVTQGNKTGDGGESLHVIQVDIPENIENYMHSALKLDEIDVARYVNDSRIKIKWSKRVQEKRY